MKKFKAVIGIPAYNEEANIGFLIRDILNQNKKNIKLEKIIVYSDGSTDRTVSVSKNIKDKRIHLIDNKKRLGLAYVENQIISSCDSDVLILLNADIRIVDKNFLEKIVHPIIIKDYDLTSPNIRETRPRNHFENILQVGMSIKNFIYEAYKNGDNVYTCHGQARAFSKRLYKKIHFPSSIGNDAYSYFYCIDNGFKYKYIKDTDIIYSLPENFKDHSRQSIRFFQSQKLLSVLFNKSFINSEYRIPSMIIVKSLLRMSIIFSIYISFYLFLVLYLKIKSYFIKNWKDTWEIAVSSKEVSNKI